MSFSFASAALAALSLMTQDGNCTMPTAPEQLRVTPPPMYAVPDCINVAANTTTCDEATNTTYNANVTAWNTAYSDFRTKAQAYLQDLKTYREAATAYAMCEQDYYVALSTRATEEREAANQANAAAD